MRLGDVTPTDTATDSGASSSGSWGDLFKQAVPALIQARYQDKLLSENFKRAQQGLPPLSSDEFKPGVTVGLDSGTKALLGGAAAVASLTALAIVASRRRRAPR